MAENCSISVGAEFKVVYRVCSTESEEIEGVYKGMAAMGTETAMAFQCEDGMHFINSSAISAMVQVHAAPEEPKKESGDRALYG